MSERKSYDFRKYKSTNDDPINYKSLYSRSHRPVIVELDSSGVHIQVYVKDDAINNSAEVSCVRNAWFPNLAVNLWPWPLNLT